MAESVITLRFCGTCIASPLSALLELADRLPELGEGVLAALDSGEELFTLHSNASAAAGTNEILIRLEPGNRLLNLLAAAGAGEADLLRIKGACSHWNSPSLCVEARWS